MSLDQILQKILSNTFTRTDVGKRLLLLQDFLETVAYGEVSKPGSLSEALQAHYAGSERSAEASAVAAWGEETLRFMAEARMHERLRELKEQLTALPELVLYTSTILSSANIASLGSWCRANIDPRILLELRTDPSAIGGCFFVWKNQYHDYSLSYFINKNREKILKNLGSRT